MIDDGNAIHYSAVERGTPVYGSDEVEVGKVDEVVDNYREHILDGIVIEHRERKLAVRRRPRGGPHGRARRHPDDHLR